LSEADCSCGAVNDAITLNQPTVEALAKLCPNTPVTRKMGEFEAPLSNRKAREVLGFKGARLAPLPRLKFRCGASRRLARATWSLWSRARLRRKGNRESTFWSSCHNSENVPGVGCIRRDDLNVVLRRVGGAL
jgi:hypothetical protein